ncbi:MAG: YggT family protein [Tepidimonas ignava]|uniref:YGGT family protein n=1 Tax=Tepidimonas ignava TaxID=114249 RepID=A0A4R3LIK8_9BURK|nr:YggT family protein [Tepidimonas ignava]MCX7815071.1 YggT family protein [Tepidimonas ignava]TCS99993.1 YggT family protein [Tepidimonas ignava]TSE19163.1 YGGT family protein [Tepidimonas ignava]
MRIVLFLLDTLFFLLVGAALLRGWMNTRRIRMQQQPGPFVIALTDWIVQPMRRSLPRAWAQANTDWGSLLAALLLALAYAGVVHALLDVGHGAYWISIPLLALQFVLRTALQGLMVLLLVYAVLSWVQPYAPLMGALQRLLEPLLAPLRRVIPTVGGVDLTVLVLLIALQVALMLLG